MKTAMPAEKNHARDDGRLSGMVRAIGADVDNEAAQRLQQLHELSRFVRTETGAHGHYILGGDFNITGGSKDYQEAVKLFGRQSTNAPAFAPTYTTRSFLTPPGWKNIVWESNLDHMFTNLDVCDFQVQSTVDISDHLPMLLTVSHPRTAAENISAEIIEDDGHHLRLLGGCSAPRSCACIKLHQGPCAKVLRRPLPQIVQPSTSPVPLLFHDVPLSP